MARETGRFILRAVQFVAANLGNFGSSEMKTDALSVHDLVKARLMAEHVAPQDQRVLDIGCGTGKRLSELTLFRPDTQAVGIDLVKRTPPHIPGAKMPELHVFDGRKIPADLGDFDVSLICYVLHHLNRAHAIELLENAISRTNKRLLLLEDSLKEWTLPYRVRNWSHMLEANLGYAAEADSFEDNFTTNMFLTHDEWRTFLSERSRVERVECHPLSEISKYNHHCLFVIHLEER